MGCDQFLEAVERGVAGVALAHEQASDLFQLERLGAAKAISVVPPPILRRFRGDALCIWSEAVAS